MSLEARFKGDTRDVLLSPILAATSPPLRGAGPSATRASRLDSARAGACSLARSRARALVALVRA
jgi:hypothetical protein